MPRPLPPLLLQMPSPASLHGEWAILSPRNHSISNAFRSSSSGSKKVLEGRGPGGKGSGSGVRRAHTTPEQEREAALQAVSQFTTATTTTATTTKDKDAPAHAVLRPERKPAEPVVPAFNEESARRKVVSIIDELVNNTDLKVGVVSGCGFHCFVMYMCHLLLIMWLVSCHVT